MDGAEAAGRAAVGRVQDSLGGVTPVLANMLGATLRPGWHRDALADGDPLPPLWHWVAFPQDTPMEGIGPDGHPALGAFLPDLGLGRRMWAGGSLRFLKPLHVGEALTRRSKITEVAWKDTGAGPMAIVSLRHAISGADGPAIEEDQSIVYLQIPDAYRPPAPRPAPEDALFDEVLGVDPVRLFRYSAATFNGHRIHYDTDYAREVEGYPGVVVHGPLLATLLFETARLALPDRFEQGFTGRFAFRAVAPVFADEPFETCAADAGDHLLLWVRGSDGRLAMRASLA